MPGELVVNRSRLSEVMLAGRTMLMYGSGELEFGRARALRSRRRRCRQLYQRESAGIDHLDIGYAAGIVSDELDAGSCHAGGSCSNGVGPGGAKP